MTHPQLYAEYSEAVDCAWFQNAELLQIYNGFGALGSTCTVEELSNNLDDGAQTALARILAYQLPDGDTEKLMHDCLLRLQRTYLENEYEKHRLLADEYERSADERFIKELMESQRIKNEIKKLYGN